ncbi:MAG: thioredoxin family protein [Gammaproteobacteria bacterium]|nr:thioredoxin family protein [Gammaproteobacteria bacterium]
MDWKQLLLLLGAIALAYLIVQGPALLRARKLKGQPIAELETVLPEGADPMGRFLFYFWSPSCGMCRGTTPVINQMMERRNDVVSLNVMEHMDLARMAGVMGTPAFMVVEQGRVEKVVFGARSQGQIEAML